MRTGLPDWRPIVGKTAKRTAVTRARPRRERPPALAVRPSPIDGLGVFTRRAVAPGTRIIEYTGEVISSDEADRRYDDEAMERHQTFLFALADGRCIDGAVGGSIARFINHSCEPNCEAVEFDGGHIWILALRPIAAGEELTYDYAYEWDDDDEAARFYRCDCGAAACRRTILSPEARAEP
jgi:SET domain-containing protein